MLRAGKRVCVLTWPLLLPHTSGPPHKTPAPATHIWPFTHFLRGCRTSSLCWVFRNSTVGLRGNYIFAYGATVVLVSIWVKSHFVSMFLFPFPLSPCAHMCRHAHKQDKVEMWHVPLLPVLVVRGVRWRVEYVLYLGVDTPDGVWKLQQPIRNLWDPWCKMLPCTVLQRRAWASSHPLSQAAWSICEPNFCQS